MRQLKRIQYEILIYSGLDLIKKDLNKYRMWNKWKWNFFLIEISLKYIQKHHCCRLLTSRLFLKHIQISHLQWRPQNLYAFPICLVLSLCVAFSTTLKTNQAHCHIISPHTHTHIHSAVSYELYKFCFFIKIHSVAILISWQTQKAKSERECVRETMKKRRVGESERDKERVANSLLSHNSFGLWKQIQFGSCLWKCLCKTCANCRSVWVCRPGKGWGKAKLKLAGKLMSHDRDRQRVSELASASCCGRGCNAF